MHGTRILVLLIALALPAAAVSARADEFSDFRIPDHQAHLLTGNLSGVLLGSREASPFVVGEPGGRSAKTGLELLSGSTQGFWFRESERQLVELDFAAGVQGRHGHSSRIQEQLIPGILSQQTREAVGQRDVTENLSATALWRRYAGSLPFAIEALVRGSAGFDQLWLRDNYVIVQTDTFASRTAHVVQSRKSLFSTYAVDGSLALGVGRVRDATGIYSARLLERRLREAGVLAHDLSGDALRKVAQLFYAEGDFFAVHDRGEKFFWRELERILREDGALTAEGMDAYGVLRALEPAYPGIGFYRPVGLIVRAAVRARHEHVLSRDESALGLTSEIPPNPPLTAEFRTSSRFDFERNLVLVGPSAEFHKPVGLRVQLDASGFVSFALKNDRVDEGLEEQASLRGTWLVADRWYASAGGAQMRSYLKSPNISSVFELSDDQWATLLFAVVGYFVEDRTELRLSLTDSQLMDRPIAEPWLTARTQQLVLGVTYHFSGGLSAPGLFAPQGLTTPGYGP